MASPLPLARDAVFVCAGADSAQRTIAVGSTDWYNWLSEAGHRGFQFESGAGGFTARKERKQRGGWYWIAYRRFQGNVHKTYLGKSEEVTLARLQDAAALLAARIKVLGAPLAGAAPTVYTPAPRAPAASVPVTSIQRSAGTAWPSGTVTFLFTDIAGSTQLWEQHPQTMPQAIAHHDVILRQAVEARGGVVFKTVGDAVCAAFSSAPAAAATALDGQRALRAEAWDLPEPLLVRMALHTGTVEMRDGDYLGPPLNRVARLLATGHGGQVLLSHATADLVGDTLPAGVTLRDLGVHALKDLRRPEQIYQLTSPDLPDDFPPLRTPAPQPALAIPQPTDLLTTKLYAPLARPNLVPRSRLVERLRAGMAGKLTLIAAPAGFGKTTLVSEWINQNVERRTQDDEDAAQRSAFNVHRYKVAWVSLDAGDNDATRFWSYTITALDTLSPGVGDAALAALQSPQPPPIEVVLTSVLNALSAVPAAMTLVLDDYHVIEAPHIHATLAFLLDHLLPQLHLVIATRIDPPLPLARLRVRGELTELRADDLRFTTDEAAAFLTVVMGLSLAADDVAALEARTEGWIAGLQLAALAMRDRSDRAGFIAAFSGSNRFVVDYLAAEVLDRLPAHLQSFVLQTAILDRMCGSLCDAVALGDVQALQDADHHAPQAYSQVLLEELERANLFITPLDDERVWYRYHHLFAEVVRGHLRNDATAEIVATLHLRASEWFERQAATASGPYLLDAIHHALLAHDWDRSARLIEQICEPIILRGQNQTLLGWLRRLPDAVLRAHPLLAVNHIAALVFTNDFATAERYLDALEPSLRAEPLTQQDQIALGEMMGVRAIMARYAGDLSRCLVLSQHVLEILPATEVMTRAAALINLAYAYLVTGDVTATAERLARDVIEPVRASRNALALVRGITNLARLRALQGRLRRAAATYDEVRQIAPGPDELSTLFSSSTYYFGLGDLHYEYNRLADAEYAIAQGMSIIRDTLAVEAHYLALGYRILARVYQARGEAAMARAMLQTFVELAAQRRFIPLVLVQGHAAQAHLALAQGDLAAAAYWANTCGLHADDAISYPREAEYLTLVRVAIAQGRGDPAGRSLDDALRLLDRLLADAEAGARMDSVIEIHILRALARQAQGNRRGALTALERALSLAALEGYVRRFVDEGAPMAELLAQSAERRALSDPLLAYIEHLLSAFPEPQRQAQTVLRSALERSNAWVEPLTDRELEVLHLIAEGASNREIATRLMITVGTVKQHINNLFGKLGVRSRTQAIRAARSHGLLNG